jgi:hypothetical protein
MEDKFDESPITGEAERSLLDQLLQESRLYRSSRDYKDLLDFVVRLRNFAPFNAMLLQIQKPGLSYAASAKDWMSFGRRPKEAARPLLILWPLHSSTMSKIRRARRSPRMSLASLHAAA